MYKVYGRTDCSFCDKAKAMLDRFKEEYVYINVDNDDEALGFIVTSGYKSVPQIFYNDEHVGGYNELQKHIFTK